MRTTTFDAEMLQLSASTHAWHRRHHDHRTPDALAEQRPAIEAFVRGPSTLALDAGGVRRLATTAVRIAVASGDESTRAALVRDVEVMLDTLALPAARAVRRAD